MLINVLDEFLQILMAAEPSELNRNIVKKGRSHHLICAFRKSRNPLIQWNTQTV
jgi:hypothetical protein